MFSLSRIFNINNKTWHYTVVMSIRMIRLRIKWSSDRLYLQLYVGGHMFYLRYLFVYSGVQHILCCVFVLFFFLMCILCCQFLCVFVLFFFLMCILCCQFLWIVLFWFPHLYYLTFICWIFSKFNILPLLFYLCYTTIFYI
jgi:hypothetical protein